MDQIHLHFSCHRVQVSLLGRRKKQVNQTDFPIEVIERVARCLWPEIQADFENEAIQKEFAEWKSKQPGTKDETAAA